MAVLAAFGSAVIRHESGAPERCPKCGSYNLDVGFNPELMPGPMSTSARNVAGKAPKCGGQTTGLPSMPADVGLRREAENEKDCPMNAADGAILRCAPQS